MEACLHLLAWAWAGLGPVTGARAAGPVGALTVQGGFVGTEEYSTEQVTGHAVCGRKSVVPKRHSILQMRPQAGRMLIAEPRRMTLEAFCKTVW